MGNQFTMEAARCEAAGPPLGGRHVSPLMKTALAMAPSPSSEGMTPKKDITALDFCVMSGW